MTLSGGTMRTFTRVMQLGRGGCSGDNVPLEYFEQGILDSLAYTFAIRSIFTLSSVATLDSVGVN